MEFFVCVVFFSPRHSSGRKAKQLITTPYRSCKYAKTDFAEHVNHQYHRDSKTNMDDFVKITSNASLIIQSRLSIEVEKQIANNRIFLTYIIKCTELPCVDVKA